MSPEILSIIVLIAMFVIASFLPVNLGAIAFVAAWLVGTLAGGLTIEDVAGGFPAELFILLVGVTYLFAIAQENGTIGWLTEAGIRMVRGYVAAIPWLMFMLAAVLTSVGALSAAGVAIVAPIAMRFAAQYRIGSLLMGVMVVQGVTAGSFSPISPFGAITGGVVEQSGLTHSPSLLYVNSLVFNTLWALVAFLLLGGVGLIRRGRLTVEATPHGVTAPEGDTPRRVASGAARASSTSGSHASVGSRTEVAASPATTAPTEPVETRKPGIHQGATLAGIIALIVGALLFELDVGFLALTIAIILALAAPHKVKNSVKALPWPVILLISGILTYVGVLDQLGTIDYVGDLITGGENALSASLAASYIGGIVSAFAATAGVLGATIPLAVPILEQSSLPVMGVISAMAMSSSIVDVSPLSTNGALLLANQQTTDERTFFRKLLLYAVSVIVIAPPLAWLIFVVLQVP